MRKIDCHTHIFTPAIRDEYFEQTDGYALVMQMPDALMKNDRCLETVRSDRRLFLCPSIDLKGEIAPQLEKIDALPPDCRVVGLKIYLAYQSGRADDPRLFPVYEYARSHRLSVTFHTGVCALVLPSDQDLEGSSARHIANAAALYPEVNFIAAHMDDPHYGRCLQIAMETPNFFTDFSGVYETGAKEATDVDGAVAAFREVFSAFPQAHTKLLYGTDFCPMIQLSLLDEYAYTIEKIFAPEHWEEIYYRNALRAFPRLRDYLPAEGKG